MAENGKDIEAQKSNILSLTTERDQLKTQLEAAQGWEQKYNAEIPALTAQRDELQNTINIRDIRDKVSAETNIPVSLLSGTNEEECKAQADAIAKWHNNQAKYPATNDGGEQTLPTGGTTREQFADWATAALNK